MAVACGRAAGGARIGDHALAGGRASRTRPRSEPTRSYFQPDATARLRRGHQPVRRPAPARAPALLVPPPGVPCRAPPRVRVPAPRAADRDVPSARTPPPDPALAPAGVMVRARAVAASVAARVRASPVGNVKFVPMVLLFFFMSFNNTILDSLGNSLVITAEGGGTRVIPFLTVYAVWPASFLFLVAYSAATQRLSRGAVFNVVIGSFLAFYAAFGLAYPSHGSLHLHVLADGLDAWVPAGLGGAVGMVRNWMFTAFYCTAELWGDVVLSLLFWGLANETTSLEEAPLLYPLFGVGANVGQTVSGKALSVFHHAAEGRLSNVAQVQVLMAAVVACGVLVVGLHALIVTRFPASPRPHCVDAAAAAAGDGAGALATLSSADAVTLASVDAAEDAGETPAQKASLREVFVFLSKSPQIRCLAVMALAQGLSTNLIEIAWKSQVHLLHPSPAAYSAIMGDVAMWTGVVTASLMLLSPTLFRMWKWKGVALATPRFMMATGIPFFVGSVAFALAHPAAGAASAASALRLLVGVGAVLQVFAKGAKFSMFKPAEEMVYIGLDEESRTKGKAAIDVAGAQTGKSLGSALQQVLLLVAAGNMVKSLPFMAVAYFAILAAWKGAVVRLDTLHVCAFSMDEDEEGEEGAGLGPGESEGARALVPPPQAAPAA